MAICTMVIVAERSGLAEHWAFSAGRAARFAYGVDAGWRHREIRQAPVLSNWSCCPL